jgi:hypothetical protein
MKMAKVDVTAPAMHTILHGKKGGLKGTVSKYFVAKG